MSTHAQFRDLPAVPDPGEPPDGRWQYGLQLPRDPRAAGIARAIVTTVLCEHSAASLAETAELLVSELVTNAFRYSGGSIYVRLRWADSALRITVRDTNSRHPVLSAQPAGPHRTRGRGLFLVRRLAHRWGQYDFARSTGGKAVWFELLAEEPEPRRA